MSETRIEPCCPHSEALVSIVAIPLCQAEERADDLEAIAQSVLMSSPQRRRAASACGCDGRSAFAEAMPLRSIRVMACSDAADLMKGGGHVAR